jgi:protein-tyrosine phosphatase
MAEFVMKNLIAEKGLSDEFIIDSAGTSTEELGNPIHYGTVGILEKYHIPYDDHRARQMKIKDYDDWDYLIGMDSYNIRNMNRISGGDPDNKIHKLMSYAGLDKDVADPWYTGNFEVTYEDVLNGCTSFFGTLDI